MVRTCLLLTSIVLAGGDALALGVPVPRGASLSKLAWLAGTWVGEEGGVLIQEQWMEPQAGIMLGMHREIRPRQGRSFEFLRIEEEPEGLVYYASPQGRPATPFKIASLERRKVVFENLDHDFPQRILYWIDDEGLLHARVEGEGEPSLEWRWRRRER
jgi:hypothetical protein